MWKAKPKKEVAGCMDYDGGVCMAVSATRNICRGSSEKQKECCLREDETEWKKTKEGERGARMRVNGVGDCRRDESVCVWWEEGNWRHEKEGDGCHKRVWSRVRGRTKKPPVYGMRIRSMDFFNFCQLRKAV